MFSLTAILIMNIFFSEMEYLMILDTNNETDIFCLHFVALPLICRTLEEFRLAWNNHKLSTEKNMSPNMLFHVGLSMLHKEKSDEIFTELIQVKKIIPLNKTFNDFVVIFMFLGLGRGSRTK